MNKLKIFLIIISINIESIYPQIILSNDYSPPCTKELFKVETQSTGLRSFDFYVPTFVDKNLTWSIFLGGNEYFKDAIPRKKLYEKLFYKIILLLDTDIDIEIEEYIAPLRQSKNLISNTSNLITYLERVKKTSKFASKISKKLGPSLEIVQIILDHAKNMEAAEYEALIVYSALKTIKDARIELLSDQINFINDVDPELKSGFEQAVQNINSEEKKTEAELITAAKQRALGKTGKSLVEIIGGSFVSKSLFALLGKGIIAGGSSVILPAVILWQIDRTLTAKEAESCLVLLTTIDYKIFEKLEKNIANNSDRFIFEQMHQELSRLCKLSADQYAFKGITSVANSRKAKEWSEQFPHYSNSIIESTLKLLNLETPPYPENSHETLLGFILDSSGSMSQNDPQDKRKSAVEMIINELNGNEKVFLVDFDDRSIWLNQSNYDNFNKDMLKNDVKRVNSDGGTNIVSGLIELQQAIESTGKNYSNGGAILLTDGKNNSPFDYSSLDWFRNNNIPISTVSFVGDVDNKLLSDIAALTNGNYFRANNASDVVMYFREFINSISGNSSLTLLRNLIQQGELQPFSFYVDKGMGFMFLSVNWSGSKIRLKLISPSNKIYNENDSGGEWYTGSNYSSVKLSNPESGKWKAEFYGESIPSGGEEYVFQVNGDSPNKIMLDDKLLISGQMQFNLNSPSGSNFSDIKSKIEVTTPKNKKEDISKNFSKDGFTYRPRDGEGNYNFEINLSGKDKSGSIMQRYFTRTILLGEGSASNIALVKLIEGNYLYADLGKDIGNFPGLECTIYSQNGNIPIASGYVTFVSETECSIEIQNILSDQSVNLGDTVELNVTQWQQDY